MERRAQRTKYTKITRARCKAYAQTMSMTLDFDSDAFYCAFTRRAIPIVLGGRTYFYPYTGGGERGYTDSAPALHATVHYGSAQRQLSVIVAVLSLWSLAVVAHLAQNAGGMPEGRWRVHAQ